MGEVEPSTKHFHELLKRQTWSLLGYLLVNFIYNQMFGRVHRKCDEVWSKMQFPKVYKGKDITFVDPIYGEKQKFQCFSQYDSFIVGLWWKTNLTPLTKI